MATNFFFLTRGQQLGKTTSVFTSFYPELRN